MTERSQRRKTSLDPTAAFGHKIRFLSLTYNKNENTYYILRASQL